MVKKKRPPRKNEEAGSKNLKGRLLDFPSEDLLQQAIAGLLTRMPNISVCEESRVRLAIWNSRGRCQADDSAIRGPEGTVFAVPGSSGLRSPALPLFLAATRQDRVY